MADTSSKEISSVVILAGALVSAVSLWILWAAYGAGFVHSYLAPRAQAYAATASQSTTAPTSTANTPDRAAAIAELGQSGDAFGGANALFAAVGGALLLWAAVLQSRSLRQAKEATKLAEKAYQDERAANRHEQFAATFFQMLTLSRQLVERIDVTYTSPTEMRRQGSAALESLAWKLSDMLEKQGYVAGTDPEHLASYIVTTYEGNVYNAHPSSLGPYFRLLFQTFKFVEEAGLSENEQIRFANIARGQISEGAVMLLAANGLTERGHRFIPLIEKFGLLEHLHKDYRNKYKTAFLTGYRERAFLGSKDRKNHPAELTPLRAAHHFTTWPDAMDEAKVRTEKLF